jgi:hypothetical protein
MQPSVQNLGWMLIACTSARLLLLLPTLLWLLLLPLAWLFRWRA